MTHQKEPWVEWLRIAIPNTEFHSSACNDVWYEQPRKLEEKRECFCGGELRYRKCIKDVENLFSRQRKEFEEAIAHAKREERLRIVNEFKKISHKNTDEMLKTTDMEGWAKMP